MCAGGEGVCRGASVKAPVASPLLMWLAVGGASSAKHGVCFQCVWPALVYGDCAVWHCTQHVALQWVDQGARCVAPIGDGAASGSDGLWCIPAQTVSVASGSDGKPVPLGPAKAVALLLCYCSDTR
jgi:hypothetical protein